MVPPHCDGDPPTVMVTPPLGPHQSRKFAAFVSAGPQSAAGDIEDLELELKKTNTKVKTRGAEPGGSWRPLVLTGAELSLFPLERTILPRTTTPSLLMFPAALMLFSATILQSITTLALVLLMAMWS